MEKEVKVKDMLGKFVLINKLNINRIVKSMGWNDFKKFTKETGIVAKDMVGNFFEVMGGEGLGKAVSAEVVRKSRKGIFNMIHNRGYRESFNTYMASDYKINGTKYYEK